MSDYYGYRESWFDQHFGKIMIGFFSLCFILIAVGIYGAATTATHHYQQCLDDGKKEYECYAIVYRGGRR